MCVLYLEMEYKSWRPYQPGEENHDSFLLHALRTEKVLRERTFDNHWRDEYGTPPAFLAERGWVYKGPSSRISCIWCGALQNEWAKMDPLKIRYYHRTECPQFISGGPQKNRLSLGTVHSARGKDPNFYDSYLKEEIRTFYASYENRLKTFETWTRCTGPFGRSRMAACGFVFEKIYDVVFCFHCGGRFGNFDYESSDIFLEHSQMMPDCEFIKNAATTLDSSLNVPDDPKTVREMLFCTFCQKHEKSMMNENCTHLICCKNCQHISHCPICKKRVYKLTTVYLA